MPVSNNLPESWKSFVTEGLQILKSQSEKEGIPELEKVRLKDKDGEPLEEVVKVPNYADFLEGSRDQLTRTTEYKALAALMSADFDISKHIGKNIRTAYGASTLTLWDYAKFPLAKQLEKTDPFVFDAKLFETTLSELLKFFST